MIHASATETTPASDSRAGTDANVARQVTAALDAGDYARVRQLVEPLHAADIADLLEQALPGERRLFIEAVRGAFDDCQRLVKAAFAERAPGDRRLSSANSINIGRLLPQMLYTTWALRQLGEPGTVVVPSGNLGNLTAATMAMRAGLPVTGFVAAHNANDGFVRFLDGADAPASASVPTLSNAMDVGVPSNLERLRSLFSDADLRALVHGETVTDHETLAAMRRVHDETGYVADPHTAVGLEAVRRRHADGVSGPMVVLSTAHPAKFPDAVAEATGVTPSAPPRLARLWEAPTAVDTIPAELDALRRYI